MKRGDTPDASNCTEKSIDPLQEKEAGTISTTPSEGESIPLHFTKTTKPKCQTT
jgi:hypothetical protein